MAQQSTVSFSGDGFQRYIARMADRDFLNKEDEREHIRRAQAGDEAAAVRLVRSNAFFILKFCERFRARGRMFGLTQSDLFSMAAIGFVRGIRAFTFEHDNKLNTYASYWMWTELGRGLGEAGLTIRLPIKVHAMQARARKFIALFHTKHGREPSPEELAAGIGMANPQSAGALLDQPSSFSYDEPIFTAHNGEQEVYLLDAHIAHDAEAVSPFGRLAHEQTKAGVQDALSKLKEVERAVLICRFVDELTLEETAVALAKPGKKPLTRERMRQIQNVALDRLRGILKEQT